MEQIKTSLKDINTEVEVTTGHTNSRISRQITVEYWAEQLHNYPGFDAKGYGIPAKYRECSFDNFKGYDKFITGLKRYSGGNTSLHGITGSGKTHLAISLMRHYELKEWELFCQNNIDRIKEKHPPKEHGKTNKFFIKVPELLLQIRDSFRDDSEMTETQILDRYSNIPFLILDDLGAEKTSDYVISTLYLLIDRRDSNLTNTIITTNLSLKEIAEKLNSRIASRLNGWYNIGMDDMRDYRKGK